MSFACNLVIALLAMALQAGSGPVQAGAAGPPSDLRLESAVKEDAGRTGASSKPVTWPRVHVRHAGAAVALREALGRAWDALGAPACRSMLAQFSDAAGQTLDRRLASLNLDPQMYLTHVVFVDDSRHTACRAGVMAFTYPGNRVVRVCASTLAHTWRQDPEHTVATLIHEMLHTLGLGENPPSPYVITQRVRDACRMRPPGEGHAPHERTFSVLRLRPGASPPRAS